MSMRKEILEKLAALVTAAFGLVAALAWNGAITAAFEEYVQPRFGVSTQVGLLLSYAAFVTLVAVLATVWVGRAVHRAEQLAFPTGWSRVFGQQVEPPGPPPLG